MQDGRKKISLRVTRPEDTSNKPFIGEPIRVKIPGVEVSKEPVNKEILLQTKRVKREMPEMLSGHICDARDFFLNELAPMLIGMSNGLQDAKEILEGAFDEVADTQHLFTMLEDSLQKAVLVKSVSFIQKYADLNTQESNLHTLLHMLKENTGHVDTEALLLKVLQLPNVQRSAERPQAQVRELPPAKGSGKHRRDK